MSGIYVSGVEMPTDCLGCHFREALMCEMGGAVPFIRRHDDCPLHPVPDHGELIDLRELLKEQLALSDGNYKVAAVRVRDICLLRVIIPADKGGDME